LYIIPALSFQGVVENFFDEVLKERKFSRVFKPDYSE